MGKTKIHQRYNLKDGTRVPGTTTIIGILDKPALLYWAWNLGKEGIDFRKARDKAADIGTIAHYLVECDIKNEKPDLSEYAPADVDKAENAFLAWLDFRKAHKIAPLKSELQLVSEKYRYGGTIDIYAVMDEVPTLIDLKTSSGIYPEMRLQLAAYDNLLHENNYEVKQQYIVRIDKSGDEFDVRRMNDLSKEWEMFKVLIPVYELKKEIWRKK